MAARRLIIVLVLLLIASIAAASLAPDRTGRLVGVDDTSTEEETTTTAPEPEPEATPSELAAGETRDARIDASERKPETVEGFVGDQLALSVGSSPPRPIEIAPLGLVDFAAENAPARFELLLREPGTYPITDANDPAVILGRLDVREPGEVEPAGDGGRGTRERGERGKDDDMGPGQRDGGR